MNKAVKAEWLHALRSGKYAQTQGRLQRGCDSGVGSPGYCCLGVLCDLYDPDQWSKLAVGGFMYLNDSSYLAPEPVAQWAGLDDDTQAVLTEMNDNHKSFLEIADYIEKEM